MNWKGNHCGLKVLSIMLPQNHPIKNTTTTGKLWPIRTSIEQQAKEQQKWTWKVHWLSHQPIARKINYLNELPHRAGKYAYTVFTVSSLSQGHVLAISSKFKSYCEINICEKKKSKYTNNQREKYIQLEVPFCKASLVVWQISSEIQRVPLRACWQTKLQSHSQPSSRMSRNASPERDNMQRSPKKGLNLSLEN